ncbi:acetyltransferase [Campylobacter sp. MIT 99-7217]|uniref:sugar O-acetyltransferase n=1 Tax=Campylobacter sp. MIT 99-7217 TaxID=535091 RepID=UPI001157E84B|nr:sugar O-acetyltransferase [Campylobacter sp. MIT 99-7217]TQR34467.1 acetyltransferase [Campylobacter sp. MIT 99-7217]
MPKELELRTLEAARYICSTPSSIGLDKSHPKFKSTPAPTSNRDIFTRDLEGELVDMNDEDFPQIFDVIKETLKLTHKLNTGDHSEEEVREIFSQIIGKKLDKSCMILPPFYVDFGKNIKIGKNFFMNQACTFMDRGGIEIGDDVFIAPKCNLTTINHDFNPYKRRATFCKGIKIGNRVWLGIGVTICPGVCIGDNSIVAAGSVVSKDVPPNVIVAGNPARIIKHLEINHKE